MPATEDTIQRIIDSPNWDQRVARVRQIPARHGTSEHQRIYAEIARRLYVVHLTPDYAYVPVEEFFELPHFARAYAKAVDATAGFTRVTVANLAAAIQAEPTVLLPLRVITGLLKNEFAGSTKIVAESLELRPLSASKIDSMEHSGTATSPEQAQVAAETLGRIMSGTLFGSPPGDLKSKQQKPDTVNGWETVRQYAADGVPYGVFLHQRHYGGAYRQVLDSTSELRGNLIEDAAEALFTEHGIPHIRTGSHNQTEIEDRFEVQVRPAPDFVVYDENDNLRAMLECKGANDGGTARDKALRFERLREESVRLGGIPLVAVLGGLGWLRVNDTLGPVVRDCDGRVFSVSNLAEMLSVAPFSTLAD
ncbi:MAG TPA: hypothetical protein VGS62_02025 [Streptosporangiaceae bacterium]|nr:hypothetical protein [Streptosporangiaceae bacterium]